jgi:predicted anti-sigma-YlaC factor YlaD
MSTKEIFCAAACRVAGLGVLMLLLAGCSLRQTAVNLIGDALGGGGGALVADDDPDLIREALPFGLKLFESLLEISPEHRGLLLAAAKGFTAYAYLLQDQADRLDASDLRAAQRLRQRARGLYLRGRDYALKGLETRHSGFTRALLDNSAEGVKRATLDDAAFLYWAGVAWAGAAAADKNNPALLIHLPTAGALVARVLELDESFDLGAAHEFFVSFEASRPGGSAERARFHYRRALELSGGERASVHLALAEGVALRRQNLAEFRQLLEAALDIEAEKLPGHRLANRIAQERARWLKNRIDELILDLSQEEKPG